MALIPEVAQRLDSIGGNDGPALRAEESLHEATRHLWESWETLSTTLAGSGRDDAPEITSSLMDAQVKISEARAMLGAAVAGIAVVRAKLMGPETEVTLGA